MEHLGITILAALVLAFGLFSRKLESTPVTPAMVFGVLGLALGPAGFGLIEISERNQTLHLLAEATLVLVLFADASAIDLRVLRRNFRLPLRLLAVGLPLTIGLGTLIAVWCFPDWNPWLAALLAAILAPTDAALGQAVVSNERVPVRIRQALNVESGLNDGICLPFVMMFLVFASGGIAQPGNYWLAYAAEQLIFGPAVGVAVGYGGAKAIERAVERGWMNAVFERTSSILLALLAYCAAELASGNGFIAAFVAGLVFGTVAERAVFEPALDLAESEGALLGLTAFFVFGATAIAPTLSQIDPRAVLYAVCSLTAIRMIPVFASLLGTGLDLRTQAFLAWFGPRGLASILYVLLAVEMSGLPAREDLYSAVMCTVLLSVLAHGLTAEPWAERYAAHAAERLAAQPRWRAGRSVEEMRARRPFRASRPHFSVRREP